MKIVYRIFTMKPKGVHMKEIRYYILPIKYRCHS